MGEEFEPTIFIGGQQVGIFKDCIAKSIVEDKEEQKRSNQYSVSLSCSIESDNLSKQVWELLFNKGRRYTKAERKLFIRTVEHYGKVEFTLKNLEVYADGFGSGELVMVCTTPKAVKSFLRMRGVDSKYKIIGSSGLKRKRNNRWEKVNRHEALRSD